MDLLTAIIVSVWWLAGFLASVKLWLFIMDTFQIKELKIKDLVYCSLFGIFALIPVILLAAYYIEKAFRFIEGLDIMKITVFTRKTK